MVKEEIPVITGEMMKETAMCLSKHKKKKPLKGIKNVTCTICGGNTMDYAEDLVFDCYVLGERIIMPNLTGLRCRTCGEMGYDAPSSDIIDRYMHEKVTGGYEVTVSTLSAGKLGLYFPKDVLRTMDIKAKIKAIIKPISKKKMVIELGA